ncbi:hypothetical protein BDU57DRAFT_512683 [Ampelomyces quisqualis]|uniref:Uncharacterized protein n=1 Tax=Ampelomyces quisqualis TaxID=50730 RepID=A0A6A5QXH4_AMPQU|nr:hypothetical protein BDU57DRAFT_512683 [Ampelomyces quisqualis]
MASNAGQQKGLIHTAGCLIIGDEVLGGKTVDTNSVGSTCRWKCNEINATGLFCQILLLTGYQSPAD